MIKLAPVSELDARNDVPTRYVMRKEKKKYNYVFNFLKCTKYY